MAPVLTEEEEDQGPTVRQGRVERMYSEGPTHKFVYLHISDIDPEDPTVEIDEGLLGLSRLVAMSPEAVGTPFKVSWNADPHNPELRFDEWPETPDELTVQCEVWGS